MPLIHSASRAAVGKNIRREREAGGKPQKQAIAIALDIQRRPRAAGGIAGPDSYARNAMRQLARPGLIKSAVAGRTDHIPMTVPGGSYILPADHVSHLGQGNTLAGGGVLDRMFKIGPYGSSQPALAHHANLPRPPHAGKFAAGGAAPADIIVAGGEYLLHPDQVAEIGGGDLNHGHEILDRWVTTERKKNVKTLSKLPGPKKD